MAPQDDAREREMRQLFNLKIAPERSRADVDAYLELDGHHLDFELKSTTDKDFSTVRDLGPDHIAKWRNALHWIFALYRPSEDGPRFQYAYYASPADMEPWYAEKERYVAPDFGLAASLPRFVSRDDVVDSLGEKDFYTFEDAYSVMKRQWSAAKYVSEQDLPDGYSLAKMTELMQLRARYVLLRGATLNNPHVPMSYFKDFPRIDDEHALTLRGLVRAYLKESSSDDATA